MFISPVGIFTPTNKVVNYNKRTINDDKSGISFKQKEDIFVSPASQKILDNIFHALYKAKQELGNTKILTKGFEVTHKYPKNISINMRKYDADTDTIVRLDDTVNGTALQVHIDKLREEEYIRFMVQMKDLKDHNGTVHLKKGNLNEFHRVYNFVDHSEDAENIDNIIETYLK